MVIRPPIVRYELKSISPRRPREGGNPTAYAAVASTATELNSYSPSTQSTWIVSPSAKVPREQLLAQRVLDLALEDSAQRACSKGGVVAVLGELPAGVVGQRDAAVHLREAVVLLSRDQIDDAQQLVLTERIKADDFVHAVKELRSEKVAQSPLGTASLFVRRAGKTKRVIRPRRGTKVAGHDHHSVAKVHRAALSVSNASIVEHLQEQVEDVGVGFFDFVQ